MTMKVRLTTSVAGLSASINAGAVVDWPKAQAQAWVKAGKAVPVEEEVETTAKAPKRETAAHVGLTAKHKGGGHYEIRRGDEVLDTVQGKAAAQDFIDENE